MNEIDFLLDNAISFQFTIKTEDFPKVMKVFKNYAMDIDYDETTCWFTVYRRINK